ncbi:MAG: prephenate/arogenate dehydrogenase [Cyanobacteria bacterium J06627_15]
MKIGIVGLGLIGGSLALDLQALGQEVWGVSRRASTCLAAMEQAMVTHASQSLESLTDADLIFVCTPIAAILPTVSQLASLVSPATVITDVGSVKGDIVMAATQLWPRFVGGHPMSGKAEAGLAAASAGLFRGRPYVLTPLPQTPADAVTQVSQWVERLGSLLYTTHPAAHDQAVALISHLPVMLGASLLHACATHPARSLAESLASTGFRDTSRVGGGNPELGRMMAQYNREALLAALSGYQAELSQLTQAITEENWALVEAYLTDAQRWRPAFIEGV